LQALRVGPGFRRTADRLIVKGDAARSKLFLLGPGGYPDGHQFSQVLAGGFVALGQRACYIRRAGPSVALIIFKERPIMNPSKLARRHFPKRHRKKSVRALAVDTTQQLGISPDAMITSIRVENFRCFEKLQIDNMGLINVIVGKNGAGKTSLLEALFLPGGDPPLALHLEGMRGAANQIVDILDRTAA